MCSTANYFILTVLPVDHGTSECILPGLLEFAMATNQHLPFCLAAISCHSQTQANQAVFKLCNFCTLQV